MASITTGLSVCRAKQSQLLVIDMQERLVQAMPKHQRDVVIDNIAHLVAAATALDIPIVTTRQYPDGLGDLIPEFQHLSGSDQSSCDKMSFSCCAAPGFEQILQSVDTHKQIIVCGVETHICVLQTVASLLAWGYEVFIATDAVCSRNLTTHQNALHRLASSHANLSCTESIVFEWLGDAEHPAFRELSARFKAT